MRKIYVDMSAYNCVGNLLFYVPELRCYVSIQYMYADEYGWYVLVMEEK